MSVRLRRLYAEYERLKVLFADHERIRIVEALGDPPDRYIVEYRVKGLVDNKGVIEEANEHRIRITLGPNYPNEMASYVAITPIFHPNIDYLAVCTADKDAAGTKIEDNIVFIGRLITFQDYNLQSPRNGDAAKWTSANLNRLPLENVNLWPNKVLDAGSVPVVQPEQVAARTLSPPPPPPVPQPGCANCGSRGAAADLKECANHHLVCQDCSDRCSNCTARLCVLCAVQACAECHGHVCAECAIACDKCHRTVCPAHVTECGQCGSILCHGCSGSCPGCGGRFCANHLEGTGRCPSCSSGRTLDPQPVSVPAEASALKVEAAVLAPPAQQEPVLPAPPNSWHAALESPSPIVPAVIATSVEIAPLDSDIAPHSAAPALDALTPVQASWPLRSDVFDQPVAPPASPLPIPFEVQDQSAGHEKSDAIDDASAAAPAPSSAASQSAVPAVLQASPSVFDPPEAAPQTTWQVKSDAIEAPAVAPPQTLPQLNYSGLDQPAAHPPPAPAPPTPPEVPPQTTWQVKSNALEAPAVASPQTLPQLSYSGLDQPAAPPPPAPAPPAPPEVPPQTTWQVKSDAIEAPAVAPPQTLPRLNYSALDQAAAQPPPAPAPPAPPEVPPQTTWQVKSDAIEAPAVASPQTLPQLSYSGLDQPAAPPPPAPAPPAPPEVPPQTTLQVRSDAVNYPPSPVPDAPIPLPQSSVEMPSSSNGLEKPAAQPPPLSTPPAPPWQVISEAINHPPPPAPAPSIPLPQAPVQAPWHLTPNALDQPASQAPAPPSPPQLPPQTSWQVKSEVISHLPAPAPALATPPPLTPQYMPQAAWQPSQDVLDYPPSPQHPPAPPQFPPQTTWQVRSDASNSHWAPAPVPDHQRMVSPPPLPYYQEPAPQPSNGQSAMRSPASVVITLEEALRVPHSALVVPDGRLQIAPSTEPSISGKAIAALCFGILGLPIVGLLVGWFAIWFGVMAIRQIDRTAQLRGRTMAVTGITLGIVSIIVWLLLVSVYGPSLFTSRFEHVPTPQPGPLI